MKNTSYPDPHRLARDEIRLIRISPGEWSDPISCKLVRDSLSSVRPYHALSYVWGSAKITRPIFLDGQPWNATVNLESALRHLRLQLLPTYLWVDALCINQIDAGERTHQVDLMGTIYRSCKGVLVYLGDGVGRHRRRRMARATQGDPPPIISFSLDQEKLPVRCACTEEREDIDQAYLDTLQLFKFIQQLADVGHIDHPDSLMQRNGLEIFESLRQLTHAPFTPWWTRVWVVQEVVLPPEVTLICGSISASWGLLSRAARQYNYHTQNCCSNVIIEYPRDCLKVLNSFTKKIQELEEMRCIMSGPSTLHTDGTMVLPKLRSDGQRSLLSLLRRFKNRKASDPRDKVYALLSLVNGDDKAWKVMIPDYSLTEVQVFRLATLNSIYSSSSLSVLQGDISRKFRQDLPSWVPDWEASEYAFDNLRLESTNLYDSCSQYVINETTVTSTNEVLFVDSRIRDQVEFTGEVMLSEDFESVSRTLKNWFDLMEMEELSEGKLEPQHWHMKKTFWRALCADIIYHPEGIRRARPEDECSFALWILLSTLSPFNSEAGSNLNDALKKDRAQHHFNHVLDHWTDNYLSGQARIGRFLHVLDMAVRTQDNVLAGCAFKGMVPVLQTFIPGFEDVLFASIPDSHNDEEDDESPRLSREDTILYGMSIRKYLWKREWEHLDAAGGFSEGTSPSQVGSRMFYVRRNVQEKESQAWNQMSWKSLLDHIVSQASEGNIPNFPRSNYSHQISVMDRSIVSATKSRRLFITKGMKIGLGPASTQAGDELCLLKGGRTPFILRRPTSEVPARGFELIGDCYADGLMDAETLDKWDKWILQTPPEQDWLMKNEKNDWESTEDLTESDREKAFEVHPLLTWKKIGLV